MIDQVMTMVVACAPSLVAMAGIVVAVVKIVKAIAEVVNKFEEVRQEIFNTKEYSDIKSELKLAHKENRELKTKLNELLTKIDRIDRSEA